MADEFEVLKLKYNNMVPAQALFFHLRGHYALRVEAPTIGKEFTDNAYIGSDPEGFLYYNDILDFETESKTKYEVSQITNGLDNRPCSLIKFSFADDPGADYYAQFLAYDPVKIVTTSGMSGFSNTGNWVDLNIGSSTAVVSKTSTGTIVTLKIGALHKKAQFTDSSHVFPARTTVSSKGNFSFKDINQITTATYANYNKDRVVFYTSPNARDFIGYFIPFEGATEQEIMHNSLGNVDYEFSGVTWSNM